MDPQTIIIVDHCRRSKTAGNLSHTKNITRLVTERLSLVETLRWFLRTDFTLLTKECADLIKTLDIVIKPIRTLINYVGQSQSNWIMKEYLETFSLIIKNLILFEKTKVQRKLYKNNRSNLSLSCPYVEKGILSLFF